MYEKCGMWIKVVEEVVCFKDVDVWERLFEVVGRNMIEGREIERLG